MTIDIGPATPDEDALRILVIDADSGVLRRSRSALEEAGFEVATADMPDIGIVRRVAPDALVLGLVYRGQASGLEFLERHLADPATSRVPVIVRAVDDCLDEAQTRRLQEAICPAEPNALLERVAACLRESTPADAGAAPASGQQRTAAS